MIKRVGPRKYVVVNKEGKRLSKVTTKKGAQRQVKQGGY